MMRRASWLALPLALTACNLAPHYVRPEAPVAESWPAGVAYPATADAAAGLPWRSMIADERLQAVIDDMLRNNRDLRASVANVAAARSLYRAQRSTLLPTLSASTSASVVRGPTDSNSFSAGGAVSGFELDLFGRLRNQTQAQFETYLSTESGMRSIRLSLIAETASAYVTLAADRDLLRIAGETAASASRSVALTKRLFDAGLASGTDVESARTIQAQAESDVARLTTQVAQDSNALALLAGTPVEEALLPKSLADLDGRIATPPAGLSSDVLLRRPDVVEAEHALKAANADIGAARAAFFPIINLTTAFGFASGALSGLFDNGGSRWSATPSATVPLIGGPYRANLAYAEAERDARVAQYEKAVQSAFRDVADALARRGTIADQRAAQTRLVTAAQRSFTLAETRYRAGTSDFLEALTAQRTLYSARQSELATRLADIANRIDLYAAVGADDSL